MYQCPMKCDNGKLYDEPGNCPVCGMKLKEVEEHTKDEHQHQHISPARHERHEHN